MSRYLALVVLLAACSGKDADSSATGTTADADTDADADSDADADADSDSDADADADADADTDTDTPDTFTFDDLTGRCALDGSTRVGLFEIAHWTTSGFATFTGSIANGVVPTEVLTPQETEGDCELYQKFYPHCDPPCVAGETCDHSGECIPYPEKQFLGTLDITGTTVPLTVEADVSNTYWDSGSTYPLFIDDTRISLTTTGGDMSPLSLRGIGVDDLTLTDPAWNIVNGEDLTVGWTPGSGDSRIAVTMSVDQHGNSPVTLMCDFEDDGEGTVPASLLETLLIYGVSGFANGTARRVTADSVAHDEGCVELLVYSDAAPQVSVEGHVPCFSDLDCPKGYECDIALNTCVPE